MKKNLYLPKAYLRRFYNIINSWQIFNILKNFIKTYINKYYYSFFPQKKYKYDKKKHTHWDFSYINRCGWESIRRIEKFIKKRNLNPHWKHIDIFSVFWPREAINSSKEIKIFLTWEDTSPNSPLTLFKCYDDYLLDKTNLSIWFKELKNKNYIRFPLYLIYLINPEMNDKDIQKMIENLNDRTKIDKVKKNFCSLVARHDISWKREEVYNKLKEIWKIDCPSRFKHNINIDLPDREAKRKFIGKYRYNICLENNLSEWYVTEKLIDAILARTIPIYYWLLNDFDKSIFNEKAYIYADDQMVKKIKELETDKKKYREMLMIKPFKNNAANIIIQHLNLLESKLRHILSN